MSFQWFADWAHQQLGVVVTVIRNDSYRQPEELLNEFPIDPDTVTTTFWGDDPPFGDLPERVLVGMEGDYLFALERFTSIGCEEPMMRRLSGPTGIACALSYTQTIGTFQAAVNGTRVLAFDLSMPEVRHGQDPDRYLAEMTDAGLFLVDAHPIAGGAALLTNVTGFELTPELLERPTLGAVLA